MLHFTRRHCKGGKRLDKERMTRGKANNKDSGKDNRKRVRSEGSFVFFPPLISIHDVLHFFSSPMYTNPISHSIPF